jgi:hypothetical protein
MMRWALDWLCSPASLYRLRHGFFPRRRARVGMFEADQNFVRRVLEPGVGFVELTGRLARQLTELVTVGHMRECPKN